MQLGGVLRGRYHLDAPLGRGGMGQVFAATDRQTGRVVAIKVVHTKTDLTLMARLQREAEAVMRLRSPFVPELYDVDITEDGELFLVMERLTGQSLAQRLREAGGALPWEEVARIGDDVLSGLVDAHEAGVIHRDLKPANIFLAERDGGDARAMVLDFGVAKLDRHDGEPITTAGEAVGTIAYMAPEQIRGASDVDARADLYSFGVVMFEALTGTLPYDAEHQLAVIAQKLERPARSLSDVGHVPIPAGVEALLRQCLRRRPEDRYPSAVALATEWRALAQGVGLPHEDEHGEHEEAEDDEGPGPDSDDDTTLAAPPAREPSLRALDRAVPPPEPSELSLDERVALSGPHAAHDEESPRQSEGGPAPAGDARSHRLGLAVAAAAVAASIFVLVLSERIRSGSSSAPPVMPAATAGAATSAPLPALPVPSSPAAVGAVPPSSAVAAPASVTGAAEDAGAASTPFATPAAPAPPRRHPR